MGAKRQYNVSIGDEVCVFNGPDVLYRYGIVTSLDDRLVRIRCNRRTLTFFLANQRRRGGGTQYFRTHNQVFQEEGRKLIINNLLRHDVSVEKPETWTDTQLRQLLTLCRTIRPEQIGEAP